MLDESVSKLFLSTVTTGENKLPAKDGIVNQFGWNPSIAR
jgi:hypothetical protein